jgi:hypothetical protein
MYTAELQQSKVKERVQNLGATFVRDNNALIIKKSGRVWMFDLPTTDLKQIENLLTELGER